MARSPDYLGHLLLRTRLPDESLSLAGWILKVRYGGSKMKI
jgi:hypothetical protein